MDISKIKLIRHKTFEEVEAFTYHLDKDEVEGITYGTLSSNGKTVDIPFELAKKAAMDYGIQGCCSPENNEIHYYMNDETASSNKIYNFIAHELGHMSENELMEIVKEEDEFLRSELMAEFAVHIVEDTLAVSQKIIDEIRK